MKTTTGWLRLACPDCQRELTNDLICTSCQAGGKYIDGIACFTDPTYYWGELEREEMQRLNAAARELGWKAAVEQIVTGKSMREYICSPHRADFQYVWDLGPDATVLDVGAGLGAITAALACNYARVVALEGVLERARFIQTRVQQAGRHGVEVMCADFLRMPLAGSQFDAIVLNGVLEWSAMAAEGDPRGVQVRFLRKVRDLLKPDGFACIGIENRIGCAALRGGIDHSGYRYTSLMPRRVAGLWCRYHHSRRYRSGANLGYRTYTYSLPGYRKLFREAGFDRIRAFHAWDGYNQPSTLLPLKDSSALLQFLSRQYPPRTARAKIKRAGLKAAAMTGLWAQLASDYVFLVSKPNVSSGC